MPNVGWWCTRGLRTNHSLGGLQTKGQCVLMAVMCVHAQSCLTLCHPKDCSLSSSSVHGILQARILEGFAISSSRGSSQMREEVLAVVVCHINKNPLFSKILEVLVLPKVYPGTQSTCLHCQMNPRCDLFSTATTSLSSDETQLNLGKSNENQQLYTLQSGSGNT